MELYERYSPAIRWSVLAHLGNLPVMKLIMLVPFIGTLIIFNESVVNLLSLSIEALEKFGAIVSHQDEKDLTIGNLYYLYFGLLSLGVGSILFSIFCPPEIKNTSDVDDYISKFDKQKSPVSVRIELQRLISTEKKALVRTSRSTYCDELYHNLIVEIYREMEVRGVVDPGGEFYNAAGYIDVERVTEIVGNDAKVVWAFSKPFQDVSVDFSGDVLRCLYAFLDLKLFGTRIAISLFYGVGMILVSLPTIKTICQVIS